MQDLEDEYDAVGRHAPTTSVPHRLLLLPLLRSRVRRHSSGAAGGSGGGGSGRRRVLWPGEGAAPAWAGELQHCGGARGLAGDVGDAPLDVESQRLSWVMIWICTRIRAPSVADCGGSLILPRRLSLHSRHKLMQEWRGEE